MKASLAEVQYNLLGATFSPILVFAACFKCSVDSLLCEYLGYMNSVVTHSLSGMCMNPTAYAESV